MNIHDVIVDAGFGTKDEKVYWLLEIVETFLRVPDLDDFPPAFYEQISEENYPETLKFVRWVVEKKKAGLEGFGATPGPDATMETFSKEIMRWQETPWDELEDVTEEEQ